MVLGGTEMDTPAGVREGWRALVRRSSRWDTRTVHPGHSETRWSSAMSLADTQTRIPALMLPSCVT